MAFRKPVVFVVGAGASAEYNLPVGDTLKSRIGSAVHFQFRFGSELVNGDPSLWENVRLQCNGDHKRMALYSEGGNELARTISAFPSIDEALHYWSDRPEIIELGKAAIAQGIINAEHNSGLSKWPDRQKQGADAAQFDHCWLWPLFSMALSATTKNDIEGIFDNVTFINFNYDRVIEHYLFQALQLRGGVTESIAAKIIDSIEMIRPYGHLGPLDWQNNGCFPFGRLANRATYFKAAQSIRTYTEQHQDSSLDKRIDAALSRAALVLFLGFGFHSQNLMLLESARKTQRTIYQRALATVFGIDKDNNPMLDLRLRQLLAVNDLDLTPRTSFALLAELRPTLMSVVG
jgi:hypothetical protein